MKPEEFSGMIIPAYTNFIQYKGVWDMQDLYETMADFFRNQKFKFYEIVYKHKHPSPFGAERQYVWRADRNVEEHYKFVLDIFFHTYDARDIEVTMKDGSKKVYTKGRIWIQFRGRVFTDYEKTWEENAFYAQLRNFYHKYVIQKKMEGVWWDEMYYKVFNKLHHIVQGRLKMEAEEFEHREFAGVH
ncbi:hypothetical protein J4458_05595 [Candidatus Woesearchaeota archaeon]|nr:hypothetical protein [Candidatus Woesearchaeota archaeon]